MRWVLFLAFLFPAFLTVSPAKKEKPEKPKQEKLATLYKNARNAVKNLRDQDAARKALLDALARPELQNKQKALRYG